MITLVLGGARSGKSLAAESLVARLPGPVTYLATATVAGDDADHRARVAAHRARRDPSWATIEVGRGLLDALESVEGSVLVDSLGTWVTACWASLPGGPDPDVEVLCSVLRARTGDTVLVSEEVGLGVHPSSELGRRFRDVMGTVNAAVAEVADEAYLVVAGRLLALDRP